MTHNMGYEKDLNRIGFQPCFDTSRLMVQHGLRQVSKPQITPITQITACAGLRSARNNLYNIKAWGAETAVRFPPNLRNRRNLRFTSFGHGVLAAVPDLFCVTTNSER
jgi:hypothetical protein